MAHFLCHLGCSHFGALLLDFHFTENSAIWLLTLFEHARHSLRSIGLSVVMNVIMMIVCTFSLSMLSTVLVPIISTRVSIISPSRKAPLPITKSNSA